MKNNNLTEKKIKIFEYYLSDLCNFILNNYNEYFQNNNTSIRGIFFNKECLSKDVFGLKEISNDILSVVDVANKTAKLNTGKPIPKFFNNGLFYGVNIEISSYYEQEILYAKVIFSDKNNSSLSLLGKDGIQSKKMNINFDGSSYNIIASWKIFLP